MILCIGVFSLSIGLAAFSSVLEISSNVSVVPDSSSFKIVASSSSTDINNLTINPRFIPSSNEANNTATPATIVNKGNSIAITGIHGNFDASILPMPQISYQFYVHNTGKYTSYLKQILFKNIDGTGLKKCTPKSGTTTSLVNSSCAHMARMLVSENSFWTGGINKDIEFNSKSISIPKNACISFRVAIYYTGNVMYADGPFDVEFGDIEIVFTSAVPSND